MRGSRPGRRNVRTTGPCVLWERLIDKAKMGEAHPPLLVEHAFSYRYIRAGLVDQSMIMRYAAGVPLYHEQISERLLNTCIFSACGSECFHPKPFEPLRYLNLYLAVPERKAFAFGEAFKVHPLRTLSGARA